MLLPLVPFDVSGKSAAVLVFVFLVRLLQTQAISQAGTQVAGFVLKAYMFQRIVVVAIRVKLLCNYFALESSLFSFFGVALTALLSLAV